MVTKSAVRDYQKFGQNQPIHEAAKEGRTDKVMAFLEKDPNLLNARDQDGLTPLHWAILGSHNDLVVLLIQKGANVNALTIHAGTPLHFAARTGNVEIAKLLLAHSAKRAAVDEYYSTPAYFAEVFGYPALAELLKNTNTVSK